MGEPFDKVIIAVGLNENVTRDQNPNVPITPAEIATDIAECVEAGASIIHVHCRNRVTGEPIMDEPAAYVERMGIGLPPEPRYLDVWAGLIEPNFDGEWLVLPYGVGYDTSMARWRREIASGGHVRVGVGDSPVPEGGFLATNAERVARMAAIAREMGREVATLADTRARFEKPLG